MLYPVFAAEGVNVSFVQELGQDGEITNFIPFYDYEHFRFYASMTATERILGQAAIYAFNSPSGGLVEISHDELGPLVRLGDDLVIDERLPLLTRLALARIGSAPEKTQLDLLREFLGTNIHSQPSLNVAVAAHKRTARDSEGWWERYRAELRSPQPLNPFLEFETEDLFRWLYDNGCGPEWSLGLATLLKRVLYDQRLFDLLTRFLSTEDMNIKEASARDQAIIGRGLELYTILDSSERDFADAMAEHIATGEIFTLTKNVPIEIILDFIDDLDTNGQLDTPAIDVYLDELSSEVIEGPLAYALMDRVLDSSNLRTPYPNRSYYAGVDRLERFQDLVKTSGRLGLVVDARSRKHVLRMR